MSLVDPEELEDRIPLEGADVEDEWGDTDEDRQRARTMGWKPWGTTRVSAEEFVGAKEFIRRGEASLPMLRRNNRDLSARLAKSEGKLATLELTVSEQKEALDAAMALARRADNNGYQRGLRELKAKQREAVETGDTAAYDQVSEQIEVLETERAKVIEPAPRAPAAPAKPEYADPNAQAYADFYEANPWFNSDTELREEMIDQHNKVLRRNPKMPLAEQLDRAAVAVKKEFPDRFGSPEDLEELEEEEELEPAPRARPASAVQRPRGTPVNPPRRRTVGFDSIPDPADREEAKKAFASLKRQYPDLEVDDYLKLYNDPHSDVLEQIAAKKRK